MIPTRERGKKRETKKRQRWSRVDKKDNDHLPLGLVSLSLSSLPKEMEDAFTYRWVLPCEQPLRRQSRKVARHYFLKERDEKEKEKKRRRRRRRRRRRPGRERKSREMKERNTSSRKREKTQTMSASSLAALRAYVCAPGQAGGANQAESTVRLNVEHVALKATRFAELRLDKHVSEEREHGNRIASMADRFVLFSPRVLRSDLSTSLSFLVSFFSSSDAWRARSRPGCNWKPRTSCDGDARERNHSHHQRRQRARGRVVGKGSGLTFSTFAPHK